MTAESGHAPTEWESAPRPSTQSTPAVQAAHYSSARHGSHVEESPELLRWRADLLMDEMMMGGVDVSAADSLRTFSGVDSPVAPRPQPTPAPDGRTARESYDRSAYEIDPSNGRPTNGSHTNGGSAHGQNQTAQTGGANRHYPDDQASSQASAPARSEPAYDNLTPREPARGNDLRTNAPTGESGRDAGRDIPAPSAAPDEGVRPYNFYERELRTSEDSQGYGNQRSDQPGAHPAGREDELRSQRATAAELPPLQTTLRTTMDGAPASGSSEQTPRVDRLYSVEQQYETFRREQSAHIQPVEPPVAARPPLPPVQPVTPPATAPRVAPEPVDEQTQWATGPDKWEYQDFSANPGEEEEPPFLSGYPAPERRPDGVRHDPAQFVSAMSVVGGGKKRSTLLPRMSTLDVDTLHREISDLHGEIAALLPVGNETSERARHLLDKAYSILQSDPMRSAEVEYYMQQVRTIVQRLHQARQWSDLYRQRLHVYLWGWLGLSAVMVVARFIFQGDMEGALMWLFGLDGNSLLVAHWATFVGTMFAGALGGAIGALYTMQAHARGEYSFFDRKYGLRGLILPFMGLIVGGLGYLIFGLVFALAGIDPSQSITAAIVPTVAAFAFGFSQESIYGTRG